MISEASKISSATEHARDGRPLIRAALITVLGVTHLLLLTHSAFVHSCSHDEAPHLVAGLRFWEVGKSDWYVVNPPLVRNVAAIAALPFDLSFNWPEYSYQPYGRPEYGYGHELLEENGTRCWNAIIAARLINNIWSVLGLFLCGLLADRVAGAAAGWTARLLWCFSPTMIGYGSIVGPDVPAATAMLIAILGFDSWFRQRTAWSGLMMGAATAIALLTKNTLILLPLVFLLLWVGDLFLRYATRTRDGSPPAERQPAGMTTVRRRAFDDAGQIALAVFACYFLILAAYSYDRAFVPLGDYAFVSSALGGSASGLSPGNRFADTWFASIPVPAPMDYLLGFDVQRWDFERGQRPGYLNGVWSEDGWYHYYLVGLVTKNPLALLTLAAGGAFIVAHQVVSKRRALKPLLLSLVASSLLIFTIVSSQTGLNQHYRYVIPSIPLLFVLAGILVKRLEFTRFRWVGRLLVLGSITPALISAPNWIGYFNLAAGGVHHGDEYLLHTSVDYGQDIALIDDWQRSQPEEQRTFLSLYARNVSPAIYGVKYDDVEYSLEPVRPNQFTLEQYRTGWWIISKVNLRQPAARYARTLASREPDDFIGSAYCVYHLTPAECAQLNEDQGL